LGQDLRHDHRHDQGCDHRPGRRGHPPVGPGGRRTFSLGPYPGARPGTQPNALAVSADGSRLYAANAGNNDVDAVQLAVPGRPDQVLGLVPTGWYPSAVAASPDGRQLYIGSMIKGILSTIDVPDKAALARCARQVQPPPSSPAPADRRRRCRGVRRQNSSSGAESGI
jgi:DNA-binding beta-propeller fold protein YncE